jgi:hypothetical protein
MPTLLRVVRVAAGVSLTVSAGLFVLWSRRWPLVGDASLIHYIAFLIEHGMAPYRDLGDMNMPGSFLIEMAAMKIFGGAAVGWRVFDFTLLAAAAGAFAVLTLRAGWFPGLFAGALFALVHGRDGLAQGGQRDLTMAVLLALATAALLLAVRRRAWWGMLGFGVLAGIALTIKPTALPLSIAQLGIAIWALRSEDDRASLDTPPFAKDKGAKDGAPGTYLPLWALAGMAVGPLVALVFLVQQHAVAAFWAGLHGMVPYYASLGHRPMGYLLLHCISPLMPLVAMWFAVLGLGWPRVNLERALLSCGVAFGLLSYLVQARGFPYYRYPLLAFLLPLMAMDFAESMDQVGAAAWRSKAAGAVAIAAVLVGGLFLGPQSAVLVHRYRWWETDFNSSLEASLNRLGGSRLSGNVQCVDSISGCGTTLYRMRLIPASGVLLDFPLFGDAAAPFVERSREEFRGAVMERPPEAIVVSSALYVDGPGDYRKLDRWPEMEDFLVRDYRLDTDWKPARTERWWSREELGPGYRIYVRR